ncbi:MAG: recombinase family protein, partial [Clostridia bacterium]|nr:recombinase family protein [Clostridia bacterium]
SAMERVSEGAEGIILESVLEGYAEYYSVELAEKVNRGMKDNALKCMNNGSVTPMGYYVDDEQHLQIDEAKAPFVVEIFERFNKGDSMASIIRDMNARGVGVTMRAKKGKKARENPLNFNIIRRMLSNRKYIGEYKFKDVVVPNGVPAIVDKALFDKVQKKLDLNKKAPARHKAHVDYLLTTKLFCGKCKALMYGESGTGKNGTIHTYYKCIRSKKYHDCDKKTVKKDWIENLVVNSVKEKIMDDALMEQLSYRLYDLQMDESCLLNSLKEKLETTNSEIDNVMTAIKKGIILDTTKKALEELEERKKQLEIDIATEQIKSPILTQEQILFLLTKFRNIDIT